MPNNIFPSGWAPIFLSKDVILLAGGCNFNRLAISCRLKIQSTT